MIFWKLLASIYLLAGTAYWLAQLVGVMRTIRAVPDLADLPADGPREWPRVSTILPARNEGAAVETSLRTRLAEDYPKLELIAVDDRSTDETGAVIDRLAAADPRVRAVHITELPAGWLGKLNAMQQGAAHATGEWLLFSDADVRVAPDALRRAVAFAERRGLDHVAAIPELLPTNFWLDTAVSLFARVICFAARLWKVGDPNSKASMGAGAFNLVRRAAFEKIGGFERLKMEPADDVALGKILKESGARAGAVNGRGAVSVYLYRTLHAAAIGVERAPFTAFGKFSVWRLTAGSLLLVALEWFPLIALAKWFWLGVGCLAMALGAAVAAGRWAGRPLAPTLFFPVGAAIAAAAMIRAGVLGWWRGGIYWRGTFYSTDALRRGHVYHF